MAKKSIDRKEGKQFITENRFKGMSDQEIYTELSQRYHDKKGVALLVTGTVTDENRFKYRAYNNMLLALIGATILFKVLAIVDISISQQTPWALVLIFIFPLLNIYFFYEVSRYEVHIYRFLGIMSILSFTTSMQNTEGMTNLLINLALCGSLAGLSFYLEHKMFPDYKPKSLEKDANGEYILNQNP